MNTDVPKKLGTLPIQ